MKKWAKSDEFWEGVVAGQQLPLPQKNLGLRGQKFGFVAKYSPLGTDD